MPSRESEAARELHWLAVRGMKGFHGAGAERVFSEGFRAGWEARAAEPLPAPEGPMGAVEQVLFRWFQATDEGTLKVSWEMYESAMRALGIETCPVCKGCGGCGECANCDAREEDWGAEGCTRCHDGRGILNPARYDKLSAALARSTPAPKGDA